MEPIVNEIASPYIYTSIVTVITLMVYFVLTFNVGRARAKYGVMPPQVDGPIEFRRVLRVQENTLEQLVLFIPLLWVVAINAGDQTAALIGAFWPVGRMIYAAGYYNDAKKRMPGFMINITVIMVLFITVAVHLVQGLV